MGIWLKLPKMMPVPAAGSDRRAEAASVSRSCCPDTRLRRLVGMRVAVGLEQQPAAALEALKLPT
jgi:hypothetical protein